MERQSIIWSLRRWVLEDMFFRIWDGAIQKIIAAANGLHAWKMLEDLTNHIDLVLTEVVMPCCKSEESLTIASTLLVC
uniref:Uncharacterized protein n=1 Tax=Cucumis sativus TaxID=3659 RepID=A0A0A0KNH5_CUCSA